jgi:hypothetical protein
MNNANNSGSSDRRLRREARRQLDKCATPPRPNSSGRATQSGRCNEPACASEAGRNSSGWTSFLGLGHQTLHVQPKLFESRFGTSRGGPHDKAEPHRKIQSSNNRPQSALDPVAYHCSTHGLGHDKARAAYSLFLVGRGHCVVGENMDCHERAREAHTTTNDPPEIKRVDESVCPSEHGRRLGRELGAALAATSRKDRATGAGTHTKTEAVDLGAATVVRLKSALTHCVLRFTSRLAGAREPRESHVP